MIVIDPISLIFGIAFGVAVAIVHYRYGWKNIMDWGNEHERTDGTNPRKQ